ncbi:DegV family protein [Butyrivibrio sp. AE2032]|uniref:DegV family protein n=1 Tax=Butyrivibrio sp. AE2032 TaxID=1458463 RepID=UPI000690E352|nr:DegV family protein [Butyrivibrio sp. AE2032]
MKKNGIIQSVINAILDPERDFVERTYLVLSLVSEVTVTIALIGDLILKENPWEIAVIVGTLIFVPSLMIFCLKKNKLKLAIKITVIGLAFIILPGLYFFGGGVQGGGVLWIIFTFTYAGLVLTGTWRAVMFAIMFAMSLLCYCLEYFFPQLVYEHSRPVFFVDSFLSIILVGIICFIMTWIENWLFMGENKRAREAAKKAEELTIAQNRFFSSMSHEIRTPINSILGLNELILRDQSASDEVVWDALGIQGSGKMLLALINDILDFSKMEAGSMDIVPVDYKVGDFLSEIVNMIWLKANEKGLRFDVSIDPKVPSVLYGDEVRMKQIIINLLNNAVKYTADGTVELHIESEEKDEKTVKLTISVSDTGMGIKKEVIPYLFDAFKRVDEEKNRHIEGTGLGLSIVKQLVELMGGTITVNSVYGEGSTFTVVLNQGVADAAQIGELNIHNQRISDRDAYESNFRAPDARILIVDDNEMNLEVESKLLIETQMTIDKALSGAEALEMDLKYHYDVILMDHLMPEMDGIECLEKIRNHTGGLNRTTPVIILTANAGSDNKELYNRAGFDGYLVKPVSGEALENALMRHISKDKMILNSNKVVDMKGDIDASTGYSGKMPVIITSTSMCDLPDAIIKKLHIPILPFNIITEEGTFKDGVQMGADELIRYLVSGRNVESSPPDEATYTEFFAKELKKAHHLIHIAITTSMSRDYERACEAAKSFDNVTVINSECLSSSTGILVLIAYKLAQINDNVDEIVEELEMVKQRLKCSFVIDTTQYMTRRGLVSPTVDKIARSLNMHPCMRMKDDRSGIGGIWFGYRRRAYKKYIAKAFPVDVIPDPEVVFITYADVPVDTLLWIKEEISKIAFFENVVFKQASAAISSNCGPGTFGILYFVKSNKSYNLTSLFEGENLLLADTEQEEEEETEAVEVEDEEMEAGTELQSDETTALEMPEEKKWYDSLEGIDGSIAIKNSGSEDAFKTVLRIFYGSIESKYEEIQGYYKEGDFKNYTIKVHALKSSCKLIGAMVTSEKAQLLENAGKEENIDYIRENHESFMEEYLKYKEILGPVFDEGSEGKQEIIDKPVADEFLMESVYDGLKEAADSMDCDAVDAVFKEIEGYAIPESEAEKFKALKEKADMFDYDGMLEILNAN